VFDALLAVALWFALPRRQPLVHTSYRGLIASLWTLWRGEPVLRRYAVSAAIMMAAFSAFWTGIALRLVQAPFLLDSRGLAWFALAGVAGTVVAPLAGKAGDRGHSAVGMPISHAVATAGVVLAGIAGAGWFGLDPAARSRLNGLFVGVFFIGGGAGAVAAGTAWAAAGWTGVCAVALALCVLAFVLDAAIWRGMRRAA
jgi:predicted MFS family arabinose efflux permease